MLIIFEIKRFSRFRCENRKEISASGRGFEETENDTKIVLRLEDCCHLQARLEDYSPGRKEAWHQAKNI